MPLGVSVMFLYRKDKGMKDFNFDKIEKFGFRKPKKDYGDYDQEQLLMGIEVEKEHVDDEEVAVIIAAHHLDEIRDYYSRLKRMEDEAKSVDKIAESLESA
jgi:hypothetical protein